jgi:transcriptional regulator with XRE-family HTH domain
MTKRASLIDHEVGRRIKLQRINAGLSQTELGDKIGVTFQQVQKYEKGLNRVGAGRLAKIADVLRVPVAVFFGLPGDSESKLPKGQSPTELLTRPYALRLLKAYLAIEDKKVQASILEMVETIASKR